MIARFRAVLGRVSPGALAALLGLVALLLYARTAWFPFLSFDDNRYLTENPVTQAGLSWRGAAWAFSSLHASNWHPLTWLSHMLDVQLFGMRPGAHHAVNAALHAADTALLFLALLRMTGARGRSAFVAALFALHPLHVESVAWVAERKDVLSTFFGFGMLLAYARHAERPSAGRMAGVAGLLALSLLSKPMWVTAPFLLLLLDLWPLQRWAGSPLPADPECPPFQRLPLRALFLEKAPLFLLAAASSAVTVVAQDRGGALTGLELGLGPRLANAAVAYLRYLGKTAWPVDLAVYYPYSANEVPGWLAGLAALAVLAVTGLALARARQAPWLALGWLWFLGTLVPVIGIVQVGSQAMADRYTYLPLVGIFVAMAWGAHRLAATWRGGLPLAAGGAAVLVLLTALSWRQIGHWSSHVALFEHALSVTTGNALAHGTLSEGLRAEGRHAEALLHAQEAVRINPASPRHWNNLAVTFMDQRRWPEAREALRGSLAADPAHASAWSNLGEVLQQMGNAGEALAALDQAARLAPSDARIRFRRAEARIRAGDVGGAIEDYGEAVRQSPEYTAAWNGLAIAYQAAGRPGEATGAFQAAVRAQPDNPVLWRNLGISLARTGGHAEAAEAFRRALGGKPGDPDIMFRLALSELAQGHGPRAREIADRLQALDPARAAELRRRLDGAP
ncbi:MAG: tetratricopeptide repeat protein [Deltaproteobacteria bacterium]|nr:tetratricopeptide repeat protein [Deltaproteobacteria bacterium]